MDQLTLYGIEGSPPVRAVLLTLNALNLVFNFKTVNLMKGEHLSEDYLKKNPQHTVPLLEVNGQYIWDSHAIMAFLVRKYAKDDSLYPSDFYKRAIVDQRLHFDSGMLFAYLRNIVRPVLGNNQNIVPREKVDDVYEAYNFLEAFLTHDHIAGDQLTIADFSVLSTVTSLGTIVKLKPEDNPKLSAWIERMKKLPYYEMANGVGLGYFAGMLKDKNIKIQ